jgi:radical SAM superfamily enzyme YgiQ (UPF0313 family)
MAHVALVGPEIEENLSLRYVAAALGARGHTSDIVAFNGASDYGPALAQVLATNPAIVGLSLAFQWRANDFLAFAVGLREGGYRGHIAAGGHFGTFAAREIMTDFPEIDSICVQEAEHTFTALAEHLEGGRELGDIAGLWLRDRNGVAFSTGHPALPDLATLPWPDRRGEPAACFGHAISPLVSSRGCYANCSFCCIAAWHEQSQPGKRYRLRDVDDVAAEMVEMQRARGIDIFVFHDDNFFVPGHKKNIERFSALADALERRGIGEFATVVKARPTDVTPATSASRPTPTRASPRSSAGRSRSRTIVPSTSRARSTSTRASTCCSSIPTPRSRASRRTSRSCASPPSSPRTSGASSSTLVRRSLRACRPRASAAATT